eukprot:8914102-Pyramimonas_sp.AAC.1
MASQPPMDGVPQRFDRRQRLVTTDGAGGITRMERNLDREAGDSCDTLKLKCEVHMVYKWFKAAFLHTKHDTSSMVHVAKALRSGDAMRSFRTTLRQVISDTLRYHRQRAPSAVDTNYNKMCLDLFLEDTSPHRRMKRSVILSLANGRWSNRPRIQKP